MTEESRNHCTKPPPMPKIETGGN